MSIAHADAVLIGDTLSIDDAALVATWHSPRPFANELFSIFAGEPVGSSGRQAWDIRCELLRRVENGFIPPVRTAFLRDKTLDPAGTTIRTTDLIQVLKERGQMPASLLRWSLYRSPERPLTKKRSRRGVDKAVERLKQKYPDGEFPARAEKSDRQIHDSLKRPSESELPFSLDSTRRALKELGPTR